jgi:hypothetical protein
MDQKNENCVSELKIFKMDMRYEDKLIIARQKINNFIKQLDKIKISLN